MSTKKKGTKAAPARYYILNGVVHELAPGELLPPALRRPDPKKRYTVAEKERIAATRAVLEHLQKWKEQQESDA